MHDRLYIMVRSRDCDCVWGTSLHRIYRKNLQRLWDKLRESAEGPTYIEYLTELEYRDIINQLNEENDQ